MICPKCGAALTSKMTVCEKCGYDAEIIIKAHKAACYFYNKGLERAKIKDISGAIGFLKRAVQLDKDYIDARNLLGLCYLAVGEAGDAIAQWVYSKSVSEHNPLADRYLGMLENNPVKLNHYKTAIRKYNAALEQIKQGADDFALVQLKRAVSHNPDYVKAWQMMALIYIHNGDYDRARKSLKRSLKTDIANAVSLRYVKLIRDIKFKNLVMDVSISDGETDQDVKDILEGKTRQRLTPKFSYSEEGPDYRVFISLVSGILIGIMVVYFLVVPGVKQAMNYDMVNKEKQYGEEISGYLSDMDSLEKENESLQSKIDLQQMETDGYLEQIDSLTNKKFYGNVLEAVNYYYKMNADGEGTKLEQYLLRHKIEAITEDELKAGAAKELYDMMLKAYPDVLKAEATGTELFNAGKELYEKENWQEANELFLLSYQESPDNEENLYLLGRTYELLSDGANAKTYYQEYLNKFPGGKYVATVQKWMDAAE